MNKTIYAIALLPALLMACQPLQTTQHINQPMQQTTQNTAKVLTNYTWSAKTKMSNEPIILHFNQNNRLYIKTGCNGQNTSWSLDGNTLKTSPMMSTMKMCSPDLMKQEQFVQKMFNNSSLKTEINTTSTSLVLTTPNGEILTFEGTLTPEAKYNTQAETIFLEILPEQKTCNTNQKCLQVREIKYNDQGLKAQIPTTWTVIPLNAIEGYQHDPQLKQIIRIKQYKTQINDQPSKVYIYDMTVESSTNMND